MEWPHAHTHLYTVPHLTFVLKAVLSPPGCNASKACMSDAKKGPSLPPLATPFSVLFSCCPPWRRAMWLCLGSRAFSRLCVQFIFSSWRRYLLTARFVVLFIKVKKSGLPISDRLPLQFEPFAHFFFVRLVSSGPFFTGPQKQHLIRLPSETLLFWSLCLQGNLQLASMDHAVIGTLTLASKTA